MIGKGEARTLTQEGMGGMYGMYGMDREREGCMVWYCMVKRCGAVRCGADAIENTGKCMDPNIHPPKEPSR